MEASGSSFGTLLAVGFLAAAKASKEKSSLELKDVAVIMKEVADAISTRGGANAGDKTFLDSILAVQSCLEDRSPQVDVRTAIRTAVASTILEYREKPNRIGRARMFGDRSIGMDDPGMVAFAHMVDCV
jgi:dihydroxyacetone kinase-like protein